jgi:hypothetical protein
MFSHVTKIDRQPELQLEDAGTDIFTRKVVFGISLLEIF